MHESPLAAELNDQQCAVLADLISLRSLKDGEMPSAEGHTNHRLYVGVSGKLAVTRQTSDGD